MTGHGMREARAEESRVTVSAVNTAVDRVEGKFREIRSALEQMVESRMRTRETASIAGNDPRLVGSDGLLAQLVELNRVLGGNRIPITGTTDAERFRSLNSWLGVTPDTSPLNLATLTLLERRVTEIAGHATSPSGGTLLARVPTPAPARAEAPAPATAAPEEARPSPAETVPVRAPPATAIAAEHEQALDNLEVIFVHGRNQAVRSQADTHLQRIRGEMDRSGGPREAQLRTLVERARTWYSRNGEQSELSRAQLRAIDSRIPGGPETMGAVETRIQARMRSAVTEGEPSLQDIANDSSRSQADRDYANRLINRFADAWLLGEEPRERMVASLERAGTAFRQGNRSEADTALQAADTVFTAEQSRIRQRLEQYVIPVAEASVTAIRGSSLPTGAQLRQREQADRAGRGTYYNVPVQRAPSGRVLRRVRNGREDLLRTMEQRLQRARTLLQQSSQPGGHLSYHMVRELRRSVTLEEATIRTVIDLWNYAQSHGGSSLSGERSVDLHQAYGFAVATLIDSDFVPYNVYSQEVRRSMARVHLGMRGAALTAEQVRRVERELLPALMRNSEYRYGDVVHKLYLEVARMAPAVSSGPIARIARLRWLRPHMRQQYYEYTTEVHYYVENQQELFRPLTEAQLRDPARLNMARGSLQTVLTEVRRGRPRGTSADARRRQQQWDEAMAALLGPADAWLQATDGSTPERTIAADRIPTVSNTLYNMAMSLASIREAQLWLMNAGTYGRTISGSERTRIQGVLRDAVMQYEHMFSVVQCDPGVHDNLAMVTADSVIEMLAPPAYSSIGAAGMASSLRAYDAPMSQGVEVANTAAPTAEESARGAQLAEERYLRMLISLRGDADFGVPASARRPAAMRASFSLLDPSVIRDRSLTALGGLSIYWKSTAPSSTTGTAVDDHYIVRAVEGTNVGDNWQYDLGLSPYGHLYMQLYRLTTLQGNQDIPEMLRQFDIAPYRGRMERLGQTYATRTMDQQLAEGNDVVLDILDDWITRLNTRLQGNVTLAAGGTFRREQLARSADPRAHYVRRAIQARDRLTRIAEGLRSDIGTDLYRGRLNPDIAIEWAEIAIASLDDSTLSQLSPPVAPPTPQYMSYVPRDAIVPERLSGVPRRVRFRATTTMLRQEDGTEISLSDYEQRHGRQNLTYFWFHYQDLGTTDASGESILYLLNPRYMQSGQNTYIGQLIRNVTLTDGTSIGPAVVRVDITRPRSRESDWRAITEEGERVRPENVLFRVTMQDGQPIPIRDAMFTRSMGTMDLCRQRSSPVDTVIEPGPTTPVLIVSPSATTGAPAARGGGGGR